MSTIKFTKREMFEAIMAAVEGSDRSADITDEMIAEFCVKEIAALDRKAEKARETQAKKKAEGDELTEDVFAALTSDFEPIATIASRVMEDNENATAGKVQYRLKVLVDTGRAEKQEITVEIDGEKFKKMGYKAV